MLAAMLEIRELAVDRSVFKSRSRAFVGARRQASQPGACLDAWSKQFKSEGWEKPSIFDIGDLSA